MRQRAFVLQQNEYRRKLALLNAWIRFVYNHAMTPVRIPNESNCDILDLLEFCETITYGDRYKNRKEYFIQLFNEEFEDFINYYRGGNHYDMEHFIPFFLCHLMEGDKENIDFENEEFSFE